MGLCTIEAGYFPVVSGVCSGLWACGAAVNTWVLCSVERALIGRLLVFGRGFPVWVGCGGICCGVYNGHPQSGGGQECRSPFTEGPARRPVSGTMYGPPFTEGLTRWSVTPLSGNSGSFFFRHARPLADSNSFTPSRRGQGQPGARVDY